MAGNFRKGLEGMKEPERGGRSPFPGFLRQIQWQKDREEKYIAFLNPASDIPTVDLHTFIPVGTWPSGKTKYEDFISRTDPGVGEESDDLADRLGKKPQRRSIAIAVELEPTYKTVNGRKRPNGFTIKTETFERKTDNGVEEVEAPVLGVVVQSPQNFFGYLGSFDAATAPIEETPFAVLRRGKDAGTQYDFTPYLDQEIDYSNLIENAANISYLRDEIEGLDLSGDAREAAMAIGSALLSKRLDELTDGERYKRLVDPIEYIEDKWGNNDKPAPKPRQQSAPVVSDDTVDEDMPRPSNSSKFDELRRMHEVA
jgi:hypothetical protein